MPLDGGPGPRHTVGAFPIFQKKTRRFLNGHFGRSMTAPSSPMGVLCARCCESVAGRGRRSTGQWKAAWSGSPSTSTRTASRCVRPSASTARGDLWQNFPPIKIGEAKSPSFKGLRFQKSIALSIRRAVELNWAVQQPLLFPPPGRDVPGPQRRLAPRAEGCCSCNVLDNAEQRTRP